MVCYQLKPVEQSVHRCASALRYRVTLLRALRALLGLRHQADDRVASVSQRKAAQAVRRAQACVRAVQAHVLPRGEAS